MTKWLLALAVSVGSVGCAVQTEEPVVETETAEQAVKGGKGGECALRCAAPPDGCHYEGAVLSGPCRKLTCGTLVCTTP